MPKIVKRKPAPKPAASAGPPRLVIVELLDLTPAADGRTVIARTLTVPETASGQVIEDWKKAKGYRVRVVEQRTPESEKFVYAQHKRFIGASQCQPSSSSEVISHRSGPTTVKAGSRSESTAAPEAPTPAATSITSKTAPSVKSPRPSSRPFSRPKKADPPPLQDHSVSGSTTTSAKVSRQTTFLHSVGSSTTSNGKKPSKSATARAVKPVGSKRLPATKQPPASPQREPSSPASVVAAVKLF